MQGGNKNREKSLAKSSALGEEEEEEEVGDCARAPLSGVCVCVCVHLQVPRDIWVVEAIAIAISLARLQHFRAASPALSSHTEFGASWGAVSQILPKILPRKIGHIPTLPADLLRGRDSIFLCTMGGDGMRHIGHMAIYMYRTLPADLMTRFCATCASKKTACSSRVRCGTAAAAAAAPCSLWSTRSSIALAAVPYSSAIVAGMSPRRLSKMEMTIESMSGLPVTRCFVSVSVGTLVRRYSPSADTERGQVVE